ncbi:7-cyano-7-deazaguanine synthase (modular protein) [Paraburkholderia ribeironis]|uniref:7-cyano-7-deazaguanine synthase n=1 Tax=Paraburkholderia ribeironis TaxID=1247936 RepID=A0A1N7SJB5_9BURK|nr:7-cyano-7-deazaguanine synthase [Paraburkholderia ribeironis]SIT47521.1 7-cyano-7-deazaguanine synthase (modular protein) [Paraburkholderia ribeironis]
MRLRCQGPRPLRAADGLHSLEDYYVTSEVVDIGGLVGTLNNRAFLNGIMRRVGTRTVHWRGLTNLSYLKHYRLYMCDSSMWETGARYGALVLYMGHGQSIMLTGASVARCRDPAVLARIRDYGIETSALLQPPHGMAAVRERAAVRRERIGALARHRTQPRRAVVQRRRDQPRGVADLGRVCTPVWSQDMNESRIERKAMVVLSGGQDSTTCLYWAKRRDDNLRGITFDYAGHHRREIDAARTVAALAHLGLNIGPLLAARSRLTDHRREPETYTHLASMHAIVGDCVELTFVPMRNAFFLRLATNQAVALDCFTLVTGVCEADYANYPDCREHFIRSMERTIKEALGVSNFRIETPLVHLSKVLSIRLAQSIPGALDALACSHTCFASKYPRAAHAMPACCAHGFEQAGIEDPLIEAARA